MSNKETWDQAAEIVKGGGLIVFPTDTVYGVGCSPYDVDAIERVYEAKSRSHLKALPLLLSGVDMVARITSGRTAVARALGKAFWPGALTLVLGRATHLPNELGGGATIAVRVPGHDDLRTMIAQCGGAIAATSANISGLPDALNARDAANYLQDLVDLIVDGGDAPGGVPSTVVDCVSDPPQIIREGAIAKEEIWRVVAAAQEK